MFNHVKSMLWLLVSVAFSLAAVIYTLGFVQQQDLAFDDLAAQSHGQRRSVYTNFGNDQAGAVADRYKDAPGETASAETYSGAEILHSLPEWEELGAAVQVDGQTLVSSASGNPSAEALEQSRKRAVSLLDMQALYAVRRIYDTAGQITGISFFGK